MIERFHIRPYDLPLRRPWDSASGRFARRRGWLLQIDAGGASGFGDCAPLPAAGTEATERAERMLAELPSRLTGVGLWDALDTLTPALDATPATRFALDCALTDLRSRQEGRPLREILSADAKDRIPVSAMAGSLTSVTAPRLADLYARGFRVVKIKVGLDSTAVELGRIRALARDLPPDMGLRLDANGAWSMEDAERMLDALAVLPIESLEEPLRQPSSDGLSELQSRTPFPLARDESLHRLQTPWDLEALGVRRVVLKPAAIGGLGRALGRARAAAASGVEVAFTSVVESAAGLWCTAQLAAATGSTVPHGLATAGWLAEDLGPPPTPQEGFIQLPAVPGSGFSPGS